MLISFVICHFPSEKVASKSAKKLVLKLIQSKIISVVSKALTNAFYVNNF